MKSGYFVGPQDLSMTLPVIPKEPGAEPILMVESLKKGHSLPFHKHKLILILSAYRHFRDELIQAGHDVEYVKADSYSYALRDFNSRRGLKKIHVMAPRDWGLQESLRSLSKDVELEFHDDGGPHRLFFLSRAEFSSWASGRKQFRQDLFYKWMRKKCGILLEPDGSPIGGKWSYDSENRKHAKGVPTPDHPHFPPSAITKAVINEVEGWAKGPGDGGRFNWPVTRTQALEALDQFIEHRFSGYGDYQDALIAGNAKLWHALLSPVINIGLLSPGEVVSRALEAYEEGRAPLNAVEGFIRQIIGWREYIRGMYWEKMPGLRQANRFEATRDLPGFFWGEGVTSMGCLNDAINSVLEDGYAHHIQRLMVIGNYCLIAGIAPEQVSHWFWAAFVDSSEWVELPNVVGMALGADPSFTTKPYAASGAYINRMSDHCKTCKYDVKKRHGSDACPYNFLFWSFMTEHRESIGKNPRLGMLYRSYDKWTDNEKHRILASAELHKKNCTQGATDYRFSPDDG